MVKVGDIVEFRCISLIEDEDLQGAILDTGKDKYTVVEVDKESRLFWVEGIEYAISFDENFEVI
jgi:hypothetical protein